MPARLPREGDSPLENFIQTVAPLNGGVILLQDFMFRGVGAPSPTVDVIFYITFIVGEPSRLPKVFCQIQGFREG